MRQQTDWSSRGRLLSRRLRGIVFSGFTAAAVLAASSAQGGIIVTHAFANGPPVNGTATAFDTGAGVPDGSQIFVVDGLKLSSMQTKVPQFVDITGSGTTRDYQWNGTDYDFTSQTNYGTTTQLAVSNPTIPGSNDANNFNPAESWTIAYNSAVVFREIDARRFDEADLMTVTFLSYTFQFDFSDVDGDDKIVDPFGSSLVIPKNTPITFTNSQTYGVAFPVTLNGSTSGNGPPAGEAWGLDGFTVEVPEASAYVQLSLAMFGLMLVRRRLSLMANCRK